MNIHPIFVHFPIALLTIYAAFECIRFKKLLALREWFYVKVAFLFFGFGGALAAIMTGDFGRSLYSDKRSIIRVHETFADATVFIFGLIGLVYLVLVIDDLFGRKIRAIGYGGLWNWIMKITKNLFIGPIMIPLALIGFVVLITTGALGGIIVYGPDMDILTRFAWKFILGN